MLRQQQSTRGGEQREGVHDKGWRWPFSVRLEQWVYEVEQDEGKVDWGGSYGGKEGVHDP